MDYKKEEIDKQTLDAYLNEIKELRDTVERLKKERLVLLSQIQNINDDKSDGTNSYFVDPELGPRSGWSV